MKGRGPVRDDRPGLGRHHALHPGPGDFPSGHPSPGSLGEGPRNPDKRSLPRGVVALADAITYIPPVTKTPRVGRHASPDGRWPDGSDPRL